MGGMTGMFHQLTGLGIPNEIRKLSHSFEYNNFETVYSLFKKFKDNVACVIMEPMNLEYPKDNFLEKIKEICRKINHY